MPKTRYGVSPWLDTAAPRTRPSFPTFRGAAEVPVAIVGGGFAGVVTAYAFAAAGVRVLLVEADRLGGGATGRSAGLVLGDPEGDYLTHEAEHGRRAARGLWQATHRAALDFAAAIRRLGLRCRLEPADAVVYTREPEQLRRLQREAQARRDAGLDASWLSARSLAAMHLEGVGGIRTRGHARIDPYRACAGFARAAAARGAACFEGSPVRRALVRPKHVELVLAKGTIRCETVIFATGEPTPAFAALRRHFETNETYAVLTPPLPAPVRRSAPPDGTIVQDRLQPPHRLAWLPDGRVIWTGADQPRTPERSRRKVLVQRGGQLMYELSLTMPAISGIQPDYVWDVAATRTRDGLPFIGPHRNYPRHLFALGLGASLTGAFLAARILLRHYEGQPERTDEYFGFARLAR
ncbi:MAG TPA: FAD-binding oxidoreductase [Vicinamibacterales bacterium]|nr:FAD-binding oxidoreductase [Vicinamibacterales bacterium]